MSPVTSTTIDFKKMDIASPVDTSGRKEISYESPKIKPSLFQQENLINVEELLILLQYYESKIPEICSKLFSDQKMACSRKLVGTSTMFFKRFFFKKSLLEFDIKYAIFGCIFIATKVEDTLIEAPYIIDTIDMVIPEVTSDCLNLKDASDDLKYRIEVKIMEILNFQLLVHLPYRSIRVYHLLIKGIFT